jgi:hypothetical protein
MQTSNVSGKREQNLVARLMYAQVYFYDSDSCSQALQNKKAIWRICAAKAMPTIFAGEDPAVARFTLSHVMSLL